VIALTAAPKNCAGKSVLDIRSSRRRNLRLAACCSLLGLACLLLPLALSAQRLVSTVNDNTEYSPGVALNPATNFTYVANYYSTGGTAGAGTTITVIDNQTEASSTVTLGGTPAPTGPLSIAVDPVTNIVYTANYANNTGHTVSVFAGATDVGGVVKPAQWLGNITGLQAGPVLININPVTNVLYVVTANGGAPEPPAVGGTLYAYAGATYVGGVYAAPVVINSLSVASAMRALAIDPVTNYVYVASGANAGSPGPAAVIQGAVAPSGMASRIFSRSTAATAIMPRSPQIRLMKP
jgi:DNA-binding beta-propeller fold protein YncE